MKELFFILALINPQTQGINVVGSQEFESNEECIQFVDELSESVKANEAFWQAFMFANGAQDGDQLVAGCYDEELYNELLGL